tara:strand:+ start:6463 stop:8133 length:1671 start_codon:yes stop_codon:yes gene_type:complete
MKLHKTIQLLFFSSYLFSSSLNYGDTLVINPITWSTPSPEGWNAQYKQKINFPKTNDEWARIIMVQTLKCDSATKGDKYPCGEWDYIWNTLVEVPVLDTIEIFSIGSFVTPYGKQLIMGGKSGWEWTYDMTDYTTILRGDRNIIVGNNQELLDLKFLFIKGKPIRDVLAVKNIYPYGHHKYGPLADDEILKITNIILNSNAEGYKLKAVISGHGHAGPRNCCEWDSKTHTYYLNGWEIFRWNVWKDCGNNPMYPQGGTWPFDRAGWCPGTKVDEYEFELSPFVNPGDTIKIDYGIEPYKDDGEKDGEFRMSHQLFAYGPPNFKIDAEVVEIITPNAKSKYKRFNPSLSHPKIIIQNSGEYILKTLDIYYGIKGRKKQKFKWSGDLSFLSQEEIYLPLFNWHGLSKNPIFEIILKNPNGNVDENQINNELTSVIPLPKIFPKEFRLQIITNNMNRSRENSFTLTDNVGKVYYSNNVFSDSTEYTFMIKLDNGDYQYLFKDDMEDGISKHWWNRNSAPEKIGIDGEMRFLSMAGDTLHEFDPDFGQQLLLNFRVGRLP